MAQVAQAGRRYFRLLKFVIYARQVGNYTASRLCLWVSVDCVGVLVLRGRFWVYALGVLENKQRRYPLRCVFLPVLRGLVCSFVQFQQYPAGGARVDKGVAPPIRTLTRRFVDEFHAVGLQALHDGL